MFKKVKDFKKEAELKAVKLQTPYTDKEKKNSVKKRRKFLTSLRKSNKLSIFMITSTVLLVVGVGYIAYQLTDKAEASNGRDYVNKPLNFTMNVPYSWEVEAPDTKAVEDEVSKTTGGVLFNMRLHALRKELVPVVLVQPDPENKLFKKIMTVAFRGSDINYSYLNDSKTLKADFGKLLKQLGNKKIEVSSVEPINEEYMKGFYIRGKGVLDKKKVSYLQYFEPAGANIMSITYGTTGESDDALEDINRITRSLVYLEGGEFTPTPKRYDGQTPEADTKSSKEDK